MPDTTPVRKFVALSGDIESALKRAEEAADGKDIMVLGGANAAQPYLKAGLLGEDGYKGLLENIVGRKDLKLLSTQTFEHGVVLMCYELVKSK